MVLISEIVPFFFPLDQVYISGFDLVSRSRGGFRARAYRVGLSKKVPYIQARCLIRSPFR